MTAAVGVACFIIGYIAGSLTLVFVALMMASSQDSRRREHEEDDL